MDDSLLFLASGRGDRTHDRADMSRLLCQLSYPAKNRTRILYRVGDELVKGREKISLRKTPVSLAWLYCNLVL